MGAYYLIKMVHKCRHFKHWIDFSQIVLDGNAMQNMYVLSAFSWSKRYHFTLLWVSVFVDWQQYGTFIRYWLTHSFTSLYREDIKSQNSSFQNNCENSTHKHMNTKTQQHIWTGIRLAKRKMIAKCVWSGSVAGERICERASARAHSLVTNHFKWFKPNEVIFWIF